MKKMNQRVAVLTLLLFITSSLLFVIFVEREVNQYIEERQLSQLEDDMVLLDSQLEQKSFETTEDLKAFIEPTGSKLNHGLRLTLFTTKGHAMYDSQGDLNLKLNDFEQLQLAKYPLAKGKYRMSDEKRENVYYISIEIKNRQSDQLAYLRLSRAYDLRSTINVITRVFLTLLFLMVVGLAAFVVLTWRKEVSQPLGELKALADGVADQKKVRLYRGQHLKSVDDLGYSINKLVSKLEYKMQELNARNEQLNKLIENLNIGIMLLDDVRQIVIVNPAMSEILGENLSNKLNQPYIHFINNPYIIELIETAYETGRAQSDEIVVSSSEDIILDATIIPINFSQESEYGLIVLFYDITEIRRLEKVRTDFVANASHELRTPVTALKGFTETLLDGAMEDKETLVHFLKIMQVESERLDSIVGDILQLSRLEQRVDRMDIEEVHIKSVVESVFHIVDQKAKNKKIKCRIDVQDDLTIYYDADILKQILLNLINNAILYNKEGGYVEVGIEKTEKHAKISVKDNGIGIQEQEQKRIFERFYRVDKARSRNSGGTGLGLSIVRHMVENSGGRITVESQPGVGSVFTVYIPLYQGFD